MECHISNSTTHWHLNDRVASAQLYLTYQPFQSILLINGILGSNASNKILFPNIGLRQINRLVVLQNV